MPRVVDVSRIGVDTGGTFTDVVAADGSIAKLPSTPADPAEAVAPRCRRRWPATARPPELMCHGTTVATNALLEGRGAEVTLVTTRGLADVIEIARQDRPSLYDHWADRPPPLVRPRPAARDRRAPGRRRHRAGAARPGRRARSRRPRRRPRRWRSACCTPTSIPRTSRRWRPRSAGRGLDVSCSPRGVAAVPRVRADRHDRRERLPPARAAAPTSSGSTRWPARCS